MSKLRPSARIGHDFGVRGDDASDLLQRLHERFGTDFSALNEQWTEFFHHEGGSPRAIVATLGLLIVSIALTVGIATLFNLSTNEGGIVGVATFFLLWLATSRLLPKQAKRPVTIEGLAKVVRNGAWPPDAAQVR